MRSLKEKSAQFKKELSSKSRDDFLKKQREKIKKREKEEEVDVIDLYDGFKVEGYLLVPLSYFN